MRSNPLLPIDWITSYNETRFFGTVLTMLKQREVDLKNAWAGIDISQNELVLVYDKKSMSELTERERAFVLCHEAAHVFTATKERSRGRDLKIWNYATDAIINGLLIKYYDNILSAPKKNGEVSVITLDGLYKLGLLPENLDLESTTADEVYDLLVQKNHEEWKEKLKNLLQELGAWQESDENRSLEDLLKKVLEKAFESVDKEHPEQKDIPPEIRDQIESLVRSAHTYGSDTADFVKKLNRIVKKRFPFKTILKKTFERRKADFGRPHRRIQVPKATLPRKYNEAFKVYAAVDVSGSCTDYTEEFLGYISALPQFEECYFFDTRITQIWKKGDPIPTSTKGYGGTDLNPVMEKFKEIEAKSSVKMNFIILTDGEIPPLKVGPTKSNVIVFTTNQPVKYSGSIVPYRNIRITV